VYVLIIRILPLDQGRIKAFFSFLAWSLEVIYCKTLSILMQSCLRDSATSCPEAVFQRKFGSLRLEHRSRQVSFKAPRCCNSQPVALNSLHGSSTAKDVPQKTQMVAAPFICFLAAGQSTAVSRKRPLTATCKRFNYQKLPVFEEGSSSRRLCFWNDQRKATVDITAMGHLTIFFIEIAIRTSSKKWRKVIGSTYKYPIAWKSSSKLPVTS